MAFCGAKFSNEEKKDEFIADHSLKNIRAFSTKKKQMAPPSKEGLLTVSKDGVKIDRRTKVIYSKIKFNRSSYLSLSQITAKLAGGMKGVGSCQGISLSGVNSILTCAHNLAGVSSRDKRVIMYKDMLIYCARQGEDTWGQCRMLDETKIRVHPKYDGQPDCGFDIGVCPTAKIVSSGVNTLSYSLSQTEIDSGWFCANPKDIKKGFTVEVAGYPGEKGGHPFTHTGVIVDVTKTTLGGYLLWYDADASPGNSGSTIMITDKRFTKGRASKVIVGVHTGHDDVEGLNFGTLITPALLSWMKNKRK